MESSGGVFTKYPKSFHLQQGKIKPIGFDEWKRKMLPGMDLQTSDKAMEKLCSKFSKLHVSDGHVFTVKDDVQKIKDAFFTVKEEFRLHPKVLRQTCQKKHKPSLDESNKNVLVQKEQAM